MIIMTTMKEKRNRNLVAEALAKFGEANQNKVRNKLIIATKISRRLCELKMSQKDFAEKIGKSAPEVSDILSGDRNLTIDTMTDIEQILNIHLLDTTLLNVHKMERVSRDKLNDIKKQLDRMSKESHDRSEAPLSNDEMYNRIISSSFERISNSKELAVEFLKSAGIFDKDGHLAPEYR